MKVVICDAYRLFGDSLASVLADRSWDIVGVAVDPAHAIAVMAKEPVDVCLMDLSFPEGNTGIDGIETMGSVSPQTKVVVLTGSSDLQLIMRAIQAGAAAIVFKADDLDQIVAVVERAYLGDDAASPATRTSASLHDLEAPPAGLTSVSARDVAAPPAKLASTNGRDIDSLGKFLTDREHEVLQHLVLGRSGKHLASQMGIQYSTLRSHIQNVITKLGVHSRIEAVAFAHEHDLSA
jgi:two-component system, NarL family, nitrate/nitrite response regulator NarL